jgi:Fe2+ transport system protein FeoA
MSNLYKTKRGKKVKVIDIECSDFVRRKIMDMGIVKGTILQVISIAPFGDPINLLVRGYHLTLRKKEAEKIIVEDLELEGAI